MQKGFALNWVVTNDGRAPLFGPRDLDALRELGAQIVRFELRLGAAPDWNDALIGHYRGVAQQLQRAGITPLGLIYADAVPGARQADWNAGNAETTSGNGENPFAERFADVARAIAAALPEITLWEIWNEPNAWRQRNGNVLTGGSFIYPSCYAALLTRAAAAIKEAEQRGTIISGGLLGHNNHGALNRQNSGADYLEAVYQALGRHGNGVPFDVIGYHLYLDQPGRADAGHLQEYLEQIQSVARRTDRAAGRPLCITEAAWTTSAVAPDVQAANLRTLFETCARDGQVAALCWFQVRDNPPGNQYFGLCAPDWSPKPAFAAFKTG